MHLLLAAAVFLSAAQTEEPAAMVLFVKGNAVFRHAGEPADKAKPLESNTVVRAGDRIDVPDAGEVTMLLLGGGERQRIKPKRVVVVGANGCDPADAVERLPAKKPASLDSIRDHVRSNGGAVGTLRGDAPSASQLVTPLFERDDSDGPTDLDLEGRESRGVPGRASVRTSGPRSAPPLERDRQGAAAAVSDQGAAIVARQALSLARDAAEGGRAG